jgi:hypothetical protein
MWVLLCSGLLLQARPVQAQNVRDVVRSFPGVSSG